MNKTDIQKLINGLNKYYLEENMLNAVKLLKEEYTEVKQDNEKIL